MSRAGEQADAGSGGHGAPPEPSRANRADPGLTREYGSAQISVLWYADRCIHSAACIRALPGVFDPQRRPWIDIGGAGPDAIADAVLRCPTGALHYVRHDGGPPEPEPHGVTAQTVRDGPLYVRGRVEIRAETSGHVRSDTRVALCRCGQSKHMPFCDNSHRAAGWRDPAQASPRDGS